MEPYTMSKTFPSGTPFDVINAEGSTLAASLKDIGCQDVTMVIEGTTMAVYFVTDADLTEVFAEQANPSAT